MKKNHLYSALLLVSLSVSCENKLQQTKNEPLEKEKKEFVFTVDKTPLKTINDLNSNEAIPFSENKELLNFMESVENLHELNSGGLSAFIAPINKNYKALYKLKKEPFSLPPIKSRLKVVHTQLMKVSYFDDTQQLAELETALNDFYISYNHYLERLNSIVE